MSNPRNNALLSHARQLRKNMTPEERHLWYDFLRYCRPRFRRQEIIGNYIADFYCDQARLILELDGSQHLREKDLEYDARRSAYFRSLGIDVARYYNNDVRRNFRGVCEDILRRMEERGVHPSVSFADSSPQGEPRPSGTDGGEIHPSVSFADSSPQGEPRPSGADGGEIHPSVSFADSSPQGEPRPSGTDGGEIHPSVSFADSSPRGEPYPKPAL